MNPILGTIIQELEGPLVAQVAQRLGIDQATAERAVTVAIPILISVLAHRGATGNAGSVPDLGPNSNAVAQGIAQSAGITPAQAQQLLSVVGPAVTGKLQSQKTTAAAIAPDHVKEIAPALSAGDHESIVSAIARLGQKVLSSSAPAGRLF
jgi:hypothetical protein